MKTFQQIKISRLIQTKLGPLTKADEALAEAATGVMLSGVWCDETTDEDKAMAVCAMIDIANKIANGEPWKVAQKEKN